MEMDTSISEFFNAHILFLIVNKIYFVYSNIAFLQKFFFESA